MSTTTEKNSPASQKTPARISETLEHRSDSAPPPAIRRHLRRDHICVLTFDRPGSSANIFDEATLRELEEHLDWIAPRDDLDGVILTSAKEHIFIAGADIHSLLVTADESSLRRLVRLGQQVFSKLAALPIPTVAAIRGACLGGGLELALACDYRVASPDKGTKIGLPETQLGILPAWGGSTRLPRLIGLPKALKMIVGGKPLAAKQAQRFGVVDELVPREYLLRVAEKFASGEKTRKRPRFFLTNNPLNALLQKTLWKRGVLRKTRGRYPALPRAIEVACQGAGGSEEKSFARELEAVVELGLGDVSRRLIEVFLLQERAKKTRWPAAEGLDPHPPLRNAAVIGAGVMGAGIAQWVSSRKHPTLLQDISEEQLGRGMHTISKLYRQALKRRLFTKNEAQAGLDRVSPALAGVPLERMDLVIEAAVEQLPLKKRIFQDLEARTRPDAILATNTSALSVSAIAAATNRPSKVVGIHFFNPVHRMKLVEVVVGRQTAPEVVQATLDFVKGIGKLPVVVKDSPGFLVNRILMPYLLEAGTLFERGVPAEKLDKAMLGFGMPMGPMRLLDEIGIDVSLHVAKTLTEAYSERLALPGILRNMVEMGCIGRKSGKGFYTYKGKKSAPNDALSALLRADASPAQAEEDLRDRLVLPMVNEAAMCLEEGVAADPGDVDFAMIMGAGFAPFRGGPLRYADSLGCAEIVSRLLRCAERDGDALFAPCSLLREMGEEKEPFYSC